jgi:hypothetical protein
VDVFFEDDIMLTVDQAEAILQDVSRRRKRKLARPLAKRWALPIPYTFDGTHGNFYDHALFSTCLQPNSIIGSMIRFYDTN